MMPRPVRRNLWRAVRHIGRARGPPGAPAPSRRPADHRTRL